MVVVREQERKTNSESDVFVLPALFIVDATNKRGWPERPVVW